MQQVKHLRTYAVTSNETIIIVLYIQQQRFIRHCTRTWNERGKRSATIESTHVLHDKY